MGMLIHLHSQATTTPKVRAAIQASDEVGDGAGRALRGDAPDDLQMAQARPPSRIAATHLIGFKTTLTPAQEVAAVALRKALLISLDDLLAVVRECLNPHVSRSGLDRCLRRHGVGNLRDLKAKAARPKHSGFKAYEPGYIHIDVKYLPQMADETSRRYLFVAIDRATRWVFHPHLQGKGLRRMLGAFCETWSELVRCAFARSLRTTQKEFTDRLFGPAQACPRQASTSSTSSVPTWTSTTA